MSGAYIKDRTDFINRQSSQKNTLVQVEATNRLINWNNISGGLYSRIVERFPVRLANCDVELTQVDSMGAVVPGTWYYNPKTGEVFVNLLDDTDPGLIDCVVTYRLFYSDVTLTASFDLSNTGVHVLYEGRISDAPGYNHKIGYEQNLTSIVGQGKLQLHNQDGELDDIFDRFYFENQVVKVFSWNPELNFDEAQIIYRGRVTNKTYSSDAVSFNVKDTMYDLNQPVPTGIYSEDDNVDPKLVGKSKRWVYGRVDGLQIDSLDKVGNGFNITGTGSITSNTDLLNGTGTLFLSEVTPGDKIFANNEEYTIDKVYSDTLLSFNSVIDFGFSNLDLFLKPETPPVYKNRNFQLTSHACSEATATVVETIQLNRVKVDSSEGFFAGDLVELSGSLEKIEIKTVAPGNILVMRQAIINLPLVGSTIKRLAVQDVYHNGAVLLEEDYTINNNSNGCFITLSSEAETNAAQIVRSNLNLKFVNGSRNVSIIDDIDTVKSILKINDLIRPADLTYTTFYSVINIDEIESTTIDYIDYQVANFPTLIFASTGFFPVTGVVGQTYKDFGSNLLYAWDGASYVIITDIYTAPATNYHTTSRVYIKDVDNVKYDAGMDITIGSHTSEIAFVNKVDGDSYIDLVTPNATAFMSGDTINSLNAISLRTPFIDPTITDSFQYIAPDFISDSSIISANVLGKTKDGLPSGEWIKSGPETVLDICQEIGIEDINLSKFAIADQEAPQLVSLSIPQRSGSKQQAAKTVVNLINKTVIGSLNMDKDLNLQYNIIQPNIDENAIPEVMDCDLISWKVKTVNGKVIESIGVDYRHTDYDPDIKESSSKNVEYKYDFVKKYIGTTQRDDLDIYLYDKFDAEIRAHRETYHRSLSRSDIEMTTDLRLENFNIGDSVVLNLERLYRRLGDNYKRKVVMIVGKKVTGEKITFFCTDFGNLYNRSNIITRNDAPCYEDANQEEKLKLGFITDNRGIIDDNEDTNNNHLIS